MDPKMVSHAVMELDFMSRVTFRPVVPYLALDWGIFPRPERLQAREDLHHN